MHQRRIALLLACATAVFMALPVCAQVLYGSLVGTVQDSSGALVPGATVTITNTGTGQSLAIITSSSGAYTFSNVLAGSYDLTVTAKGFRTYTQKSITVTVNTVRREDITLEVGQVTETVTVQAAAQTLQTEKTDVHVELDEKVITNLPLPKYRNYQTLINLVPGATPGQFQNSIQAAPARTLGFNINGVNKNNNATRIDGALSVFIWLPQHAAYVPPAETIETVNISTNDFDAEQGMAGGAAITVMTKTGTNDIHGSAFAFNDNSHLRARNFFNSGAKPMTLQNIDGFTLGGPIRKNRLFYFGGWEGNRERQAFTSLLTVGTPDQRAGDFRAYNTTIYDPTTGNPDGSGRTAFPNNMVPLIRQSSITRKVQDLVPLPNRPGVAGNFFSAGTQKLDRDNFDAKINWNRTDSHSIWGKYSAMRGSAACQPALGAGGGPALCQSGSSPGTASSLTQVATIGHTFTLSPRLVWDAMVGWNRTAVTTVGFGFGQNVGREVLGIPGTNGPDIRQSGAPQLPVSGYTPFLSDTGTRPFFWNDSTYTLAQNFGWVKGTHDFRFGFEAARHHLNHWQPELGGGPQGRFNFNSGVTGLRGGPAVTQFNAYAAFLLGLPETVQKSLQYEKMTAFNYQYAWYFRDRWHLTPKLTLSLGLRYELYPMMTRAGRGGIEEWDPNTNLVLLGGAGGNPRGLGITTGHKLLAPRVGIAYRLDNHTVLRTGYGITYNPMPLARPLRGFYPLTIALDFNSPNSFQSFQPIEQGIPEFGGPDESTGKVPLPPAALMRFISGNQLKRGYVESWNFIIERELPGQFLASVGYVGTQTIHSFGDLNVNAAAPGTGTAGRPFFSKFGRTVDTNAWNGFLTANYHALQVSVNRRAAAGLTVKGAYTYSKAINFTDEDGWVAVGFNYLPHFSRNRAQAGYNIPQIFQLGYVYELPLGRGKKYATSGAARWIAGGWQINGVTSAIQGRPFTVAASGAALNAPGNDQTADQIKPTVEKLGGVGPGQFFYDPKAFAPVNEARFGTSGRNLLRGPGIVNLDLGIFRKFPLSERFTLEFRTEAYNCSNTPHFDNPSNNVNNANFMQVLSAQPDQRQFRFGLRLVW